MPHIHTLGNYSATAIWMLKARRAPNTTTTRMIFRWTVIQLGSSTSSISFRTRRLRPCFFRSNFSSSSCNSLHKQNQMFSTNNSMSLRESSISCDGLWMANATVYQKNVGLSVLRDLLVGFLSWYRRGLGLDERQITVDCLCANAIFQT